MRRQNENNDNRYYAYLPPTGSPSSRNPSSNSINRNAHYQYYDPRLRTRQQAQQNLYEMQYSSTSPNRSPATLYGSPRNRYSYQPPSFLQDIPSSSINTIADLGEPISIFDDIKPLEQRRAIVAPPLSSTYVPPNPSQRPSVSDVRIETAHVLREQLLTDIERTMNDIDRDLTSLERRPSVQRYIPPRFSPIIELDTLDQNLFRQTTKAIKPVSVPVKKPIPIITSPMNKKIQQTSAHSTTTRTIERNSVTSSQIWPNKPKRIYEVIPSLTSDSRKASRQSSVGAPYEQIKITEIQSPQSSPKLIEKNVSSSKLQLRGQYHYPPEAEETEILSNDPENIDHKSILNEMQETSPYETLNTDQFLRAVSNPPESRAMIFVPEFSGNSRIGYNESVEDLIQPDQIDNKNAARPLTVDSFHDIRTTKELTIQDSQSLIQRAPEEVQNEPELKSQNIIIPHEIHHVTEIDLENQINPIISKPIQHRRPSTKASRTTPIITDDLHEKSSSLQMPTIDSIAVAASSSSPHPPPSPPPSSPPPPPPADSNADGRVPYFFSDFGNEGEGEEDLIPIDQSNFDIPTGTDVIADDSTNNSLMGQSQASLLHLHSAHVLHQQQEQQQQQQQLTSAMSSNIKNNNEHRKVEENEEIESKETDATNKRITTTTSVLPSPSLSPKKILPSSIIDDMQTQFARNNSTSNDDHHRQPSTKMANTDAVDSNIDEQEKRSNSSQIRLRSSSSAKSYQVHSRIQSATSEKHEDEQIKNNNEETHSLSSSRHTTPLKSIDNEHIETLERIDSVNQRLKSSSRALSRSLSRTSSHTKNDEEITRVDSARKISSNNLCRENSSTSSRTISRPPSKAPSEQSHTSQRRPASLRPLSNNDDLSQLVNSHDHVNKIPTNENEPNAFSAESEHFLHNEQQTPYDLNQRIPSNYSISNPSESRRSSTASLTLPVTLNSPDHEDNQPKTSRTTTPKKKHSVSSIDVPSDPNVLLTTTDDPDPNDPSIINSTMHLQILSSQQPNTDISTAEPNEPSPLENIVSLQEFPSRIQSAELPTEENLRKSSSGIRRSPSAEIELVPNNELPPVSRENSIRLQSVSPSNHQQEELLHQTSSPSNLEHQQEELLHQTPSPSNIEHQQEELLHQTPSPSNLAHQQEELLHQTPSPSNIEHQQEELLHQTPSPSNMEHQQEELLHQTPSPYNLEHQQEKLLHQTPSPSNMEHQQEELSHQTPSPSNIGYQQELLIQSPLLSYPKTLEDLKRSTSPPLLSPNEHQQQEQDESNRLPTVSTPINEITTNNYHHIEQNSPDKLEHNDRHSQLSSPRRSVLSNTNHTSVEGDDTYRQQLDTPSISPQNERIVSSDKDENIHNNQYEIPKQNLISTPIKQIRPNENQRYPSSEKSNSPLHVEYQQHNDDHLYRNDIQLNSATIKFTKNHSVHSSSSQIRPTSNEEDFPSMTPSQLHSKLSLRVRKKKSKRKKSIDDQQPSSPQIDTADMNAMNNDDDILEKKPKQRQRRRVSFSSSIAHYHMEERQLLTNWRERVAAILSSKHRSNEKYAHVQSRVNSFGNFEYQPKKIKIIPVKILPPKIKKPKPRPVISTEEQTDDEQQQPIQSAKPAPQLFGRLWCLPDGSPTVFHESLEWNVASRLRSYSYENLYYEPHRSEFKIFNKKPKWHSESKLGELLKEHQRFPHRQHLIPTNSLPIIPDRGEPYFYQQSNLEPGMERKIFDIHTNIQQLDLRLQQNFTDNLSHRSYGSRPSEILIFNEKPVWTGKSKIKDTTWQNINYQPKKSKVQIFHKSVRWNGEPKIRTHSPSTIYPSGTSMSHVQIFDEKLNWDAQAKVHCWSEVDLRQLTKKKAIFAQHHDPKWNDIVTPRVDATNYNYSKLSNPVEIFSDRLAWTKDSELKDYVWENFDYKSHPRTRQSPANRPKWNAVSKIRSVNTVYNPKVTNSTMIRRGWDQELRRKRVHKLPPIKRKRKHDDIPRLAIDALPPTLPSNAQLAIDYNYDHSSTTQDRTISNGYATTSSRRSSKALVPINHHRHLGELDLLNETPRSQRPVQQEWYDEMNKSRLTHRTDMERITNHSFRNSIDSIHQPNTPRELATFRSSTRNSQNSVMSGTLLDSSVRTNRTTEFRLSKDMDEHHQHSHTPSQSMPIEIRGFKLEGTQLSVADHATIRPLSNVSYGASERVKSRRAYPWSSLHPHGTSSRNSSLVPIAEFRRPSLETTITEAQQFIHEE
ncbi:unnamed protein product [Rotaria sp. Silwood2]|nr:unnamed protein product [Rotaria sp. Silwood2]